MQHERNRPARRVDCDLARPRDFVARLYAGNSESYSLVHSSSASALEFELPRPKRGEADVRLRAAGERPNFPRFQMCGAPDNRAAQMSLTLTLSPPGAREPDRRAFACRSELSQPAARLASAVQPAPRAARRPAAQLRQPDSRASAAPHAPGFRAPECAHELCAAPSVSPQSRLSQPFTIHVLTR